MDFNQTQKDAIKKEREGSPIAALCCDDHGFYPGRITSLPMAQGCKYCIMADLYYQFAKTPPHLREQRLDELESLVHHMVEDIEHGTFSDIVIFDRPIVTIEKDESTSD